MAGVFDKPARYALINKTQYNGSHGCTKWLQSGGSLRSGADETIHMQEVSLKSSGTNSLSKGMK
jgi:hypothetical protein